MIDFEKEFDKILEDNKCVLERLAKNIVHYNAEFRRMFVSDAEFNQKSDKELCRIFHAEALEKCEDGGVNIQYKDL